MPHGDGYPFGIDQKIESLSKLTGEAGLNKLRLGKNVSRRKTYLDPLLELLSDDNPLDVDGRDVNLFRRNLSDLDDLLHFGDAHLGGLAHRRIEVHRGASDGRTNGQDFHIFLAV